MLRITDVRERNIDNKTFGGKAVGLLLLSKEGFLIPETFFIEACKDIDEFDNDEFQFELEKRLRPLCVGGHYHVAIRSSSTIEDAFSDSMAGHFKTFLGRMSFDEIILRIKEVVISLKIARTDNAKMGIIIQQMVDADFSGVLFSSDPLTYSKRNMIISYVSGIGDKLVSGAVPGQDILISVNDEDFMFESSDISHLLVDTLCRNSKKLERKLNHPLDFEWAIKDGKVYYLQCRPLSNITRIATQIKCVNKENLMHIPQQLLSHDKITLRLKAQDKGILISDAYLYIHNTIGQKESMSIKIEKSCFYKGYSAVIVYPQKLSSKVIRSFVGDKKKVFGNVSDCCRYGIRSFPKYENISECLDSYSKLVTEEYWISTTIIQEIYDPLYTGVLRQIKDGYLLEITRGHFLTKGVVPTSQYTIMNGKVTTKCEVKQRTWFRIIEGHVIYCVCNEGEDMLVTLTDDNLVGLVEYFNGILCTNSTVIEFGVLKLNDNKIQAYLIDFVDDGYKTDIAPSDISTGVISRGRIIGEIVHVPEPTEDSLDFHFHDEMKMCNNLSNPTVFFCKKPDISLLSLLETNDPKNIGFVFEDGSALCHFAVVLREKNIPAVKIGHFQQCEYPVGGRCILDADMANISGKERVKNA